MDWYFYLFLLLWDRDKTAWITMTSTSHAFNLKSYEKAASMENICLIINTLCDHQYFRTWWTLTLCVLARRWGCPGGPVGPTLALMMVGLGSKMPCIFLKAGMTKRLQVTTADTGFPRTDGRTDRERTAGRERRGENNIWVTSLQNRRSESLFLSTSHTTWEGKDKFASTVNVQCGKCCWETEKEKNTRLFWI